MGNGTFTDNERIADFVRRHEISEVDEFWKYVESDSEMYRIMADDPDGTKLQYSSGRMAEMKMLKERREEEERRARICCIDHVQEYCERHTLFNYDEFLAHAEEHEKELAEYVKGLDDVPLGRLAVVEAIRKAEDRWKYGDPGFDWRDAGVPVDSDGDPIGI